MPKYKHIVWDWNGTLFDDAWLCREVVNGLLVRRGQTPLDEKRYQDVFGFPVIDYYRRAGFDFNKDPWEILAAEFIREYERRRKECGLRKGAKEILKRLAKENISQSILSAYSQKTLEDVVSSFGIREYFKSVYGLDNHYAAGKEDVGRKMMGDLEYESREIVLVGDTTHDYEVAKALGIDSILIPCGHHSQERLESCRGTVVSSLDKAAEIIFT